MQCVYQASDILEASIVKGLLEQQAIDVHLGGFYLQGGVGEIPVSGNTRLWVAESDAARARMIIQAYQTE